MPITVQAKDTKKRTSTNKNTKQELQLKKIQNKTKNIKREPNNYYKKL